MGEGNSWHGFSQIYAVFYHISLQFGTRGRQEHHQIKLEDLRWVKHPKTNETEYIECVEGNTKTRQGGLQKPTHHLTQRMFPSGGPVAAMELIVSKRPADLQTPLQKPKTNVWFSRPPVGLNTINQYMKHMATQAGLSTTQNHVQNHGKEPEESRSCHKRHCCHHWP